MKAPLVSILVANYNNGRFIAETLESAVKQTYPSIEIVIVDDGSKDNSLQVIEGFKKSHSEANIKLFKNADNRGCGRIKRQCIELSQGEYFIFLDPEDTLTCDAIAILLAEHERGVEYSIVYGTHYLCDEQLRPQSVSSYPGPIPIGQSHLTSTEGHISAPALCRRSCYDRTEGINPTFYVSEDQDLYLKMEEVGPVLYVDKTLYYYRKHDNNTSWNEAKVFNNYYWKYHCVRSAYIRRKKNKSTLPNFTKREMDSLSLSYHIRFGKHCFKEGKPFKAIISYFKAIPFLYSFSKSNN